MSDTPLKDRGLKPDEECPCGCGGHDYSLHLSRSMIWANAITNAEADTREPLTMESFMRLLDEFIPDWRYQDPHSCDSLGGRLDLPLTPRPIPPLDPPNALETPLRPSEEELPINHWIHRSKKC